MTGSPISPSSPGAPARSVEHSLLPLLIVQRNFKLADHLSSSPSRPPGSRATFDLDEDQLLLRRVDAVDPTSEIATVSSKRRSTTFGRTSTFWLCLVGGWAGGRDVARDRRYVRFDRMIDLNLRSTFNTVRAAIPHMREARTLGAGSSCLAAAKPSMPPSGQAAYNVAKAGVVIAFSRSP